MKYCLPIFFLILISFVSNGAFAQINIDYPSTRAIFQRDKNNFAKIYVAGSFTKAVDRIEAKLIAINRGTDTEWIPIQTNPQGGFYSGNIVSTGGWYELRVRGMRGDQEVGTASVQPVGIGEVFLIGGQSNGQGFQDSKFSYGAQRANDDRVNCIAYNNIPSNNSSLPYPTFSHLESNTQISPRGQSAWSWGKLGDLLADRFQVPILFYNVAWEGTLIRSWRESINGTAASPYIPTNYEPSGMPYSNLRSVLQYYVPITGIRGVLWIQGEGDNQFDTQTADYAKDLKAVIDASRNDSGKGSLAWIISLTSYTNKHGIDDKVIQGQKQVINPSNKIFQGPNTDNIQIPRTDGDDGVHFHHEGLTSLGQAWSNALNNDFFQSADPYQAMPPLEVIASCAGNNSITLSVKNDGYSSINWNTGQNSQNIQVGNGTFRVTARDGKGNLLYSPEIKISEPISPPQPSISLEGSNPVCLGNTAILIGNTSENVRWNTGSTSDRLPVTTGGEYFLTGSNVYGCETSSSRISVAVLNSPLPAKPAINAVGALTFCEGGEVNLQSNSQLSNRWSNGANTNSISVKSSGEFSVRALDNVGCFSPESDPVTVKVNTLPTKPAISLNGSSTFCAGGNVVLTSSYDNGNTWSNAATSKTISVTESGTFSLRQRDSNGCESGSDPINIKVNPLPPTPAITALRPTTFCSRDYTTLRSSDAAIYLWSNGSNNREIDVYESGSFTISQIDANRCVSPPSVPVRVVVNPLPPTPVITASGPTAFCADLSVNLTSTQAAGFLWSNGSSSQSVKITNTGVFSVQTINEFKCFSDRSNQINTRTLALPPAPTVAALGVTTFCDGDFVALRASNGNMFIWSNGTEKDTIHATESGAYSARVKDVQGCFSPYSPGISVDVKPNPTVPNIKQIGVFTLLSENNINAGEHVWKLNSTVLPEKSTMLKAVESGSYVVNNTIIYSSVLTCSSDFSAPFNFILDTSNNGLVAYPSPVTDGRLTIETLQNITDATVQIVDLRGVVHQVYHISKFDSRQFFNISDLSSGLYIVRILSNSLNASQKIIIVK